MLRFIFVLFYSSLIWSQSPIVLKTYQENFCVRAFTHSKVHYLARLSYNNQTIYVDNLIHPEKRTLIFSNENKGVKSLSFNDNEKYLAASSYSGTIDIWNIDNRSLFKTFTAHDGPINMVKFIPKTTSFISAGNDGNIFLTSINDKSQEAILIGSHEGIVRSFDISEDGNFLVSVGHDRKLILWNLKTYEKIDESDLQENILSTVKFYDQNKKIVVTDIEGNIFTMAFNNLKIIQKSKIHNSIITSLSLFNEKYALTTSFDGVVKRINLKSFLVNEIYFNKNYLINSSIYRDLSLAFSDNKGNLSIIELTK